jgi:hypothetical protein
MKTLVALAVLTAGIVTSAGASAAPVTNAEVERLVQSFYDQLAVYDYEGMHAASTPEFEIIENNGTKAMRMDWAAFDARLEGAQKAGAVLKFQTSDFYTTVTPDVAYTTYVETGTNGKQYYAGITLRRAGDEWLVDRFFTMPKPPEVAAESATE